MAALPWLAPAVLLVLQGAGDWSVAVTTSGGFAGTGRGSVLVHSDGRLAAARPASRGASSSCPGRLSGAELRRIAAAVEASRPETWGEKKLGGAAPDAFGYVLELRRGPELHKAAWYDNTRSRLPADLGELFAAVEVPWQGAVKGCDES